MNAGWRRGINCPVCGGLRKDCRQSLRTNLIHCRVLDAAPRDYIYLREDAEGFGMWQHRDDRSSWVKEQRQLSSFEREQRRLEHLRLEKERERAEREKYAQSLSVEERDKQIRKILDQLFLWPSHEKSLRDRFAVLGLEEKEIDRLIAEANYKSVRQWQKLDQPVDDRLPGVRLGGLSLLVPGDGIIIPIKNESGLYIGLQVRLDNELEDRRPERGDRRISGGDLERKRPENNFKTDSSNSKFRENNANKKLSHLRSPTSPATAPGGRDGNKYVWLAGERKRANRPSSKLQNGELPLAIYLPECTNNDVHNNQGNIIGLAEGVGFKPCIAIHRLNIPFIGASGGHFYKSPELLRNYLSFLLTKYFVTNPDQASVKDIDLGKSIRDLNNNPPTNLENTSARNINSEKSIKFLNDTTTKSISAKNIYSGKTINNLNKVESLQNVTIVLFADAGSPFNETTLKIYSKTFELLTSWGFNVKIGWWNQFEKSVGDIDEIKQDILPTITYISWSEFLEFSKPEIVRIIGSRIPLTQRGKNYSGVCPFHSHNSTNPVETLLVEYRNHEKKYWCTDCGASGDGSRFVKEFDKLSLIEKKQFHFDNPTKDQEYLWAKGERNRHKSPSSHLPWGELPLSVDIPDNLKNNDTVGLCSGVDHRPQLASDKLNIPFIGADKGRFANSPITLKLYLKKLGRKKITLFPAPGAVYDRPQLINYYKTINEVEKLGYPVVIAWWGQLKKSALSIHQLDPESSEEIKYLTPAEFRSLAAKEQYKKECWSIWHDSKKFTPDIIINKKYFRHHLPESGTFCLIKSPLGSGKTTELIRWLRELARQGKGIINLGYRNTLLIQFCEKANQKDPEKNLEPLGFYHLLEDRDSGNFLLDPQGKIVSCINSIIRFKPEDFDGKIIVLDEIVSVIKHMLYSGTIKDFSQVITLFEEVIRRADRVICLDGFNADWVGEYLTTICPSKKLVKIENKYVGDKPKVNYLEGSIGIENQKIKKNDRSPWLELLLNNSAIPAICSDSQVFIEAMDELLSAKGVKTLRADSKTAPTKEIKEFLKDPETYIRQHKIEATLYTPTAESGLDIKITNYFTEHFAFFFGVLDVDSIMQMIGRIRDVNVPKYIWVKQFVKAEYGQTADKEINIAKLQAARYQNVMAELAKVHQGDNDLKEKMAAIEAIYQKNIDAHSVAADKIKTIWNYEKPNLRECVKSILIENNYQLESIVADDSFKASLELVKDAKAAVKEQNAFDIFNASDRRIGDNDLSLNNLASWEKRCEVLKAWIVKTLPRINETEIWSPDFIKLIKYDRPNLVKQLNQLYLLKNPEIAKKIAADAYHRQVVRDNNGERIPPWKQRQQYLRIQTAIDVGVLDIINNPNQFYTKEHSAIVTLVHKCKKPEVNVILGKPGKSPMKYVGNILRSFGVEWREIGKRIDGKKCRGYKACPSSDKPENQAIVNAIAIKYEKYHLDIWQKPIWETCESTLTQNQTLIEGVPLEHLNVYNLEGQSAPDEELADLENQQSAQTEEKTDLIQTERGIEGVPLEHLNVYSLEGQSVPDEELVQEKNQQSAQTESQFILGLLKDLENRNPRFKTTTQIEKLLSLEFEQRIIAVEKEILSVCPDFYSRWMNALVPLLEEFPASFSTHPPDPL